MKAIPVAPQSIRALVAMVLLLKESLHKTTRCLPSITISETDKLDKHTGVENEKNLPSI